MFTYKIVPIISNVVETISGKDIIPKSIGTDRWSWTDDEGQLFTKKLINVIYFSYSPVSIISETWLDGSIKDYEVTWVPTKNKYYIFTWDFGTYKTKIAHSENCL